MKSKTQRIIALAVIVGACWNGAITAQGQDAEQREAEAARAKDPAWKPKNKEVDLIKIGDGKNQGALRNFCLDAKGNILACYAPRSPKNTPAKDAGVRVYSPKGDLLKTFPLEISPSAICVGKDGSIFVAGNGKLLKLDANGKVLASASSPVADLPVVITKEIEEMVKQSKRPVKEELEKMRVMMENRRGEVTGVAATSEDVFMTVPTPNEFTYRVYRFDQALQNQKLVVEKLRGCCGQMDIQAHDGKLMIPHNARHAVEVRDRDGAQLSKFGKAGKVKATDFGGCCEPKNMRVLANGEYLVAESGPPTCIKRFSADGKFIEVVGLVTGESNCVRVTVDVSPDGKTFYMLDTTRDAIRVFGKKS